MKEFLQNLFYKIKYCDEPVLDTAKAVIARRELDKDIPLFPLSNQESEFDKQNEEREINRIIMEQSGIIGIFEDISKRREFKLNSKRSGQIRWGGDNSIVGLIFFGDDISNQKRIFAKIEDEKIMIGYSTGGINSKGENTFGHIPNERKDLREYILSKARAARTTEYC